MTSTPGLGEFLRTRRSHLRPEDIALPDFGGRRRVAGLRREEIAQLAGVSVDYYTRMEQGRVPNPSPAVLDALAHALRLDQDESAHLHRLTRAQVTARTASRRPAPPQRVRPMLQRLLDELSDLPAMVMGRRMEVLAWNAAAAALFGDYAALPPAERNIARITFLDPASRHLYANWTTCARGNVAYLRLAAGRHPDDPQLANLIGELSMKSEDFRRWWAEHPVQDKTAGTKHFHHPVVGDLELTYETLRTAEDPDQALITYAARRDTPSHSALQMLLAWNTPAPSTRAEPRAADDSARPLRDSPDHGRAAPADGRVLG